MDSVAKSAKHCRVASVHDKVLNSECAYTFHSPYTSSKGILVNLNHWIGMIEELAISKSSSSSSSSEECFVFVRIVKERVIKESKTEEEGGTGSEAKKPPTKLGIGIEGGFESEEDKYTTVSKYSVVVIDPLKKCIEVELPYREENKNEFPMMVQQSVDSIIMHVGLSTQQDVKAFQLDNDEDMMTPMSKYADTILDKFVDNGIMISPNPKDWKCQKDPEHTTNLWFNLSTGYIGGGRKNWDGSGGSNGALDHFNDTGKQYPLVIKLGTITPELDVVDLYSYAPEEDGPIKLPKDVLTKLLQKRGINISQMSKTDKSTLELEVELNATYAFDAITESNSKLVPITGPGYQGLQNLGNSCYMNSILQLLFSGSIPELAHRYGIITSPDKPDISLQEHVLVKSAPDPKQAPDDILCQTAKVSCAITSGIFAKPTEGNDNGDDDDNNNNQNQNNDNNPKYRLAPRMFKHVIGKDHVDFRTGQQQDSAHYLLHLLELLDRAEIAATTTTAQGEGELKQHLVPDNNSDLHVTSHLFSFQTTSRLVCNADNQIKYKDSARETLWSLRLPMEKAVVIEPPASASASASTSTSPMSTSASTSASTITTATTATAMSSTTEEDVPPEHKRYKADVGGEEKGDDGDVDMSNKEKEEENNKEEIPTLKFSDVLESWSEETVIEDIRWKHLQNSTSNAKQTLRLKNFPRYLFIQVQRYTMGSDWTPRKLEVNLDIEQEINLTSLKSMGPQEHEKDILIPEDDDDHDNNNEQQQQQSAATNTTVIDENALAQLMDMGFHMNGCKRALTAVGGSDVEAAMNWVFEHNQDADFNDPMPEETTNNDNSNAATSSSSSGGGIVVDEAVVTSLVENLGCFTSDQVRAVLKHTSGSADRAADWLFSHMDDLDTAIANLNVNDQPQQPAAAAAAEITQKIPLEDSDCGKYTMIGMISHIGKHTGSGHYVSHLLQKSNRDEKKWVIFNDEKVAYSESPPFQHAYMYLFQRNDTLEGVGPHPNY